MRMDPKLASRAIKWNATVARADANSLAARLFQCCCRITPARRRHAQLACLGKSLRFRAAIVDERLHGFVRDAGLPCNCPIVLCYVALSMPTSQRVAVARSPGDAGLADIPAAGETLGLEHRLASSSICVGGASRHRSLCWQPGLQELGETTEQ